MFIVNGSVEIQLVDSEHNKYEMDILKQGDTIGQYSVLSGLEFEFSATAMTHVRLLTLSDNFFRDQCDYQSIEGFITTIDIAQEHIDEFDIPICDF